jgi:DNA-binding transcriptional ArsR family regulator
VLIGGSFDRPTCRKSNLLIGWCKEPRMKKQPSVEDVSGYAEMLATMGASTRLRIMQLLLSARSDGMVVGDIASELQIPGSSLSHHLEKLKNRGLVAAKREGTFLRYTVNRKTLRELVLFLYDECCIRNQVIAPEAIGAIRD